jgi:hypothetical protein
MVKINTQCPSNPSYPAIVHLVDHTAVHTLYIRVAHRQADDARHHGHRTERHGYECRASKVQRHLCIIRISTTGAVATVTRRRRRPFGRVTHLSVEWDVRV